MQAPVGSPYPFRGGGVCALVIPPAGAAHLDVGMESTAAYDAPPITPAFAQFPSGTGREETLVAVEQAERLIEQHAYGEALEAIGDVRVPTTSAPELALRVLLAEGWARLSSGQTAPADAVLKRARALSEGPEISDAVRAETLFRLGACRLTMGRVSNAISLLTVAIGLAERDVAGDPVAVRALEWRARCHVRQREWESAQADADRSLELAETLGDLRLIAASTMQCSVIAERNGDPRLALFYAERAHASAAETGDRRTEARLLNNMGGLKFLLDEPEVAVARFTESYSLFFELGFDVDAAQVVSSLAQVHLRCGAPQLAEEQARHALSILDGRADYIEERGNVHLVLGRALVGQSRLDEALKEFAAAEWLFESFGSASHVAAAWMAQGDLYDRQGDLVASLALFRRAAEALQDFNF